MISVNDRVRECFAMQSPYRPPWGTQPHFLIKGMTVPSEVAQSLNRSAAWHLSSPGRCAFGLRHLALRLTTR